MRGLTQRQREVLHAIRDYRWEHGHSPTMREIADLLGWKRASKAWFHVWALVKKGYLTATPKRARTLRLTGKREE